ncbi:hypothetical protein FEM48_Zijuj02G0053300 [Ziziphus jujuba var. spinosa]|uniref:RING-type domain-containing protein n=1 Tax=Ziziphus jujuba var. spinosa TaxID=714518 RepID=A0A978VTV4_ZIZJJ|nr:hypothetical protein FEM48_Zijuj02G0053300 [Ziziphus jujuba var. spinosa]
MEESHLDDSHQPQSLPPSSSSHAHADHAAATGDGDPSSSSSFLPSTSQLVEEENNEPHIENHAHDQQRQRQQEQENSVVSYRVNISISDGVAAVPEIRNDVWSCAVVILAFWFFAASMTLILGFFGSVDLQMGPNCSRLEQTNPFFVQSIQAEELDEAKPGPMLYGFHEPPPLNVNTTWTEKHNTFVPANSHKARKKNFIALLQEWVYFLNTGSSINVIFHVKSPSSRPLLLIIAKGRDSLVEWIEDPSYPNTTLSWKIIHGRGKIQQDISQSSSYYIAVGNLNTQEVEVELEFTINSILYNTSEAYYKCSLGDHLCSLRLSLGGAFAAAVLTSPGHTEDNPDDDWYVKLSYGPRWLTYLLGSGFMTLLMLLAFRSCNMFQSTGQNRTGFQQGEVPTERTPLLLPKDDDISSWGSSYDSASHEEDNPEACKAVSSLEGKPENECENSNNTRRLCVICFDSSRDCFFLPCGHCAACFTCGTRIAEEAGTCPICRRRMKKVRKIFTV